MKDKVAIVTGAGAGIAAVTTKLFAAEGAKVVAADWNAEGLRPSPRKLARPLSQFCCPRLWA